MAIITLKSLGKALRKFINTDEVITILAEGDWGAGGCWILAETLKRWLREPARLMAVVTPNQFVRFEPEHYVAPYSVDHVVVEYVDLFIDYNGAQTEAELLRNLREEGYQNPRLVEFTSELAEEARAGGIPCEYWQVKRLLELISKKFGKE